MASKISLVPVLVVTPLCKLQPLSMVWVYQLTSKKQNMAKVMISLSSISLRLDSCHIARQSYEAIHVVRSFEVYLPLPHQPI